MDTPLIPDTAPLTEEPVPLSAELPTESAEGAQAFLSHEANDPPVATAVLIEEPVVSETAVTVAPEPVAFEPVALEPAALLDGAGIVPLEEAGPIEDATADVEALAAAEDAAIAALPVEVIEAPSGTPVNRPMIEIGGETLPAEFKPTSNRPIDRFVALCWADLFRMEGSTIPMGTRGQHLTIVKVGDHGVSRETSKGGTSDIPRAAIEWAIKQLYLNGELARSKMTEAVKENGSTIASAVFAVLGASKYFEATDNPLTLHFYKLQWEDLLYG